MLRKLGRHQFENFHGLLVANGGVRWRRAGRRASGRLRRFAMLGGRSSGRRRLHVDFESRGDGMAAGGAAFFHPAAPARRKALSIPAMGERPPQVFIHGGVADGGFGAVGCCQQQCIPQIGEQPYAGRGFAPGCSAGPHRPAPRKADVQLRCRICTYCAAVPHRHQIPEMSRPPLRPRHAPPAVRVVCELFSVDW